MSLGEAQNEFFQTLSELLIVIATYYEIKKTTTLKLIFIRMLSISVRHCVNEYIAIYKSLENSYCALYLCDVLFYYQKSIDLNHRRAHIKAKETDIFSPRIFFSIPASRFTSL